MRPYLLAVATAVAITLAPTAAQAATYLSPFAGITFGGDIPDPKPTFGGAAWFMSRGAGLEVEVGLTPDVLGDSGPDAKVTTLSASYVAGGDARNAGVKPYGLVGLTLLRTTFADIDGASENEVAMNLAGGLVVFFNPAMGLRGEIRYFRQLQGASETPLIPVADHFDFWRAIIAVSFRLR